MTEQEYEQDCIDKYIALARENESLMIAAIREFHPYYVAKAVYNEPITAPAAEAACAMIREQIKAEVTEDPVVGYKQYQADKVMRIANEVWYGMPESSSVRNHSAFAVVCELAEGY